MSVQLIIDNKEIPIKWIKFSDGGSNCQLLIPDDMDITKKISYASITIHPTTPADDYVMQLMLVEGAVGETFKPYNNPAFKFILNLPYLPHARADRVFEIGNPHPLYLFLSFVVEDLNFKEINLVDPHSEYYKEFEGVWPEFNVKTQTECFLEVRGYYSGDVLIAPDKGARPKIEALAEKIYSFGAAYPEVVEAGKKRDISTGRVLETTLPDGTDLSGKRCIIIDDIADGGGTFIPLAQKLKEAGATSVELYVTHGIFAKGLNVFKGIIDKIHVYQTVGTYITMQDIHNFNDGKEVK